MRLSPRFGSGEKACFGGMKKGEFNHQSPSPQETTMSSLGLGTFAGSHYRAKGLMPLFVRQRRVAPHPDDIQLSAAPRRSPWSISCDSWRSCGESWKSSSISFISSRFFSVHMYTTCIGCTLFLGRITLDYRTNRFAFYQTIRLQCQIPGAVALALSCVRMCLQDTIESEDLVGIDRTMNSV